jgi:hypothetical protein
MMARIESDTAKSIVGGPTNIRSSSLASTISLQSKINFNLEDLVALNVCVAQRVSVIM